VRSIPVLLIGLVLAFGLGLWTAWLTVRSPTPIDAIRLGAWQAWPNAGTPDVDPYSRARLARTGEIPLGTGEGLSLVALSDDDGDPLEARCDYRIVGQTPSARLWTVALEDAEGRPVAPAGGQVALASESLLRMPDGAFQIVLSRQPQAGNWLATGEASRFRVVVRLYDTTARVVTALTILSMPQILRERCA
jgi:hypothetical protein